jgi:hypothetical protein
VVNASRIHFNWRPTTGISLLAMESIESNDPAFETRSCTTTTATFTSKPCWTSRSHPMSRRIAGLLANRWTALVVLGWSSGLRWKDPIGLRGLAACDWYVGNPLVGSRICQLLRCSVARVEVSQLCPEIRIKLQVTKRPHGGRSGLAEGRKRKVSTRSEQRGAGGELMARASAVTPGQKNSVSLARPPTAAVGIRWLRCC